MSEGPLTIGGKLPVSSRAVRNLNSPFRTLLPGRRDECASSGQLTLFLFLIPDENKEYFLRLQRMIEEMAEKAGGPVVLVAHSMGNMYTLYFLNQQPQAWKDRYIKAFISLGPPWAGVAKTLRVLISGKTCDLTLVLIILYWDLGRRRLLS